MVSVLMYTETARRSAFMRDGARYGVFRGLGGAPWVKHLVSERFSLHPLGT